ncbi:caspase family protein [Uliginosibacterium sp. H1]|uniref:caspase family protein n=1 Tax=Uliginosibacterium sp. H1 TaxID=3114757 RepID=UPI002E17516C|nr:caspase family protein [Uliginosibacterium sp. H1]
MARSALCIGINDYPSAVGKLAGCVNDAHDWSAMLSGRGFAVKTLLDAQATRAALVDGLSSLIGSAKKGDTVVITYSGHGTWVPDESGDETDARDEGWCPHDLMTAGALLDDEIHAIFGTRAAGVRIVLISDSCHSGSVTRGDDSDVDAGAPKARFAPPAAWMKPAQVTLLKPVKPSLLSGGMSRTGGDLLLSGCTDVEFSWDTSFRGRPNGAFTYYALKVLAERKPATYEAWFKEVRSYLPSTSLPQNPQIYGSRGARKFKVLD